MVQVNDGIEIDPDGNLVKLVGRTAPACTW